jgi:hypothetical protein
MIVNYQKIYEQLGYLFYAIASADKHLRKKEMEILKKDIEKEWIPLEDSTDEFGTDAANYIYFTFDSLLERDISPREAFESFRSYFIEHAGAFDETVRKKIQKTVLHMTNAFAHKNKTEEYIIKELRKLLHRKKTVA